MDLRSLVDVASASLVLDYQPFILSDDVQTGAAYSFIRGGDPRVNPPLVIKREELSDREWSRACDANARLRAMYDDLLDEVASRFPKCSLFDVACNNGYFPVGAELRGMRGFGMDSRDHSASFKLLNKARGTNATFIDGYYDSIRHRFRRRARRFFPRGTIGRYDVSVVSAIMCHIPDPLYFLSAVAGVSKRAILFWGQMLNSSELLVSYKLPHNRLSELGEFPHAFNDNTRISRGLFDLAMKATGFSTVIEIDARPGWLRELHAPQDMPLDQEIVHGSQHRALLAIR